MARRSQAWKDLERATSAALGGRRVLRGSDFSVSEPDVIIDDFDHLKIDCKYRVHGWSHHKLVETIEEKYCRDPADIPVLVTKSGRKAGACVTIPLSGFRTIILALRGARSLVNG